jgi:hypothetical protein
MGLISQSVRWGGSIASLAALALLVAQDQAPATLGIGVGLLLVGGYLGESYRLVGYLVATAGAAAVVMVEPFPERPLFQVAAALFVIIVGGSMADLERRRGRVVSVMLVASLGGIYLAVPSPDEAFVLLLASLILIPLPEIRTRGGMPIAGLLVWVAAVGGEPRTGSIVGALACVGILVIEPISVAIRSRLPHSTRLIPVEDVTLRLLLVTHLLVVALASRISGFREKSEPALAIALLAFAIGWSLISLRGPKSLQRWWRPL